MARFTAPLGARALLLCAAVGCVLAACTDAARMDPASTVLSGVQAVAAEVAQAGHNVLQFPDSYTVEYTWTLPYVKTLQPHGLSYPVQVWVDGPTDALRMDTYDGMVSELKTSELHSLVSPHGDQPVCALTRHDGPTCNHMHGAPLNKASFHPSGDRLPEGANWKLVKTMTHEDGSTKVNVWEYTVDIVEKHNTYKFLVTEDGVPVRLHMHGSNIFDGSHYDEYIAEFTSYTPGRPDPKVFDLPSLCMEEMAKRGNDAASDDGFDYHNDGVLRTVPAPISLRSAVMHGTEARGDSLYESFMAQYNVVHDTAESLEGRAMAFHHNRRYIEEHNANPENNYQLGMNHFGDLSDNQFEEVHLPNMRLKPNDDLKDKLDHVALIDKSRLPAAVDWRGTGADGPIMDQANCGSCYAFSAASIMRASWFMATGQSEVLSEQQIVDCTWEYGNAGCGGGNYEGAVQYIIDVGGAVLEKDYEYLGVDSYCKGTADNPLPEGVRRVANFEGFVDMEEADPESVMEALYSRGPLAISINANPRSLRFYASGVLDDPTCTGKWEDLDHAVMLMGYGTSEDGEDYWIMKNSWSEHWGNGGYIYITRTVEHDCGITTNPMYVIADATGMLPEEDKRAAEEVPLLPASVESGPQA